MLLPCRGCCQLRHGTCQLCDSLVQDPNTPIVSTEGLTRRYGDVTAVDGITLRVPRGTILGVIGPSGSGKTTLIRMLVGTLEPTGGRVEVLGQHPRKFGRH